MGRNNSKSEGVRGGGVNTRSPLEPSSSSSRIMTTITIKKNGRESERRHTQTCIQVRSGEMKMVLLIHIVFLKFERSSLISTQLGSAHENEMRWDGIRKRRCLLSLTLSSSCKLGHWGFGILQWSFSWPDRFCEAHWLTETVSDDTIFLVVEERKRERGWCGRSGRFLNVCVCL